METIMTKFLCLSGKAQHGKDTSAELILAKITETGKKAVIIHYADLLKHLCTKYFGWNGEKDEAGRTLLQRVGTDVVRKKEPDYWVNFVLGLVNLFQDEWDYVIIPDCRFPNEILTLKKSGYPTTHVRVIRPNFDNGLTEEQQNHISETALDNFPADITLINTSLNGLKRSIDKRLEKLLSEGGE